MCCTMRKMRMLLFCYYFNVFKEEWKQIYILQVLPLQTNLKDAYQKGTDDEQKFIQNLSLFLCTFLKEHGMLIERKTELHEELLEVSVLVILLYKAVQGLSLNFSILVNRLVDKGYICTIADQSLLLVY